MRCQGVDVVGSDHISVDARRTASSPDKEGLLSTRDTAVGE
jgi:hypothetical protein